VAFFREDSGTGALDNHPNINSLNLPAGSYVVTATVSAFNHDGDPQTLACALDPMNAVERVTLAGDDVFQGGQLTIIAPLVTAVPVTVVLRCGGFQIVADRNVISAIGVSSVTVAPPGGCC
jgi:hypothetical protein